MGVNWHRQDNVLIQSSCHCRCGRKTIYNLLIGNSQYDSLFVVENHGSSDEVDHAINDLLEGTGVTSSAKVISLKRETALMAA